MLATAHRHKVLKLARRRQGVTAGDLSAAGIHRQVLTRMVAAGQLERVMRGVYRLPSQLVATQHHGLVLACVAVLLMGFTPLPRDAWWQQSRLLPTVQRGAEWMASFLPPAAAGEINFDAAPAVAPPLDPGAPPEAAALPVSET